MALGEELYQRDLEVALALSVKELPAVTIDVGEARDRKMCQKCQKKNVAAAKLGQ